MNISGVVLQMLRLQLLNLDDLFRNHALLSDNLKQIEPVGKVAYINGFLLIAIGGLTYE